MDSDTSRGGDNKMTNQFSFLERATQTMNNAKKVTLEDLFRYKLLKLFKVMEITDIFQSFIPIG